MRRRTFAAPTLALVAVLALVGAGCGKKANTGGGGGTPSASAPSFTTLKDGVLTVASCLDFPPFESVKQGDQVGFDVDLTEEIAKRLGLTVQWVKADFEASFTALAGDQYDMIAAAITATGDLGQQRDQVVDFSDFYFNSRQSLTVNTEKTPDITSTDDLKSGDVVGAQKGTTGKKWAEDNLGPRGIQVKAYTASPDSFRDLEAGNLVGVINDEQPSLGIIADLGSTALKLVEGIDTNEKYAFAFSPSNPELSDSWNQVMADVIADGTYTTIFQKYFPGLEVPPEFQAK